MPAPKPVYSDPVYDGAADPAIIWNKTKKKWWMFYTNRRATDTAARGVEWVHGTRIGIAESDDAAHWKYLDTADIRYRPDEGYTFWAPAVIEEGGLYHMYLTYVPGVFTDWNHPRRIVHVTSSNLVTWTYVSTLRLATEKVIDAYVFKMPGGGYRMWYNNESDHKSIYYADSPDLYQWTDKGKAITDMPGEGPVVFNWQNRYWMIVDNWKGMGVYSSADLLNWQRQEQRIAELPGKGKDDQAIGGHADVVVRNGHAYLYYFTHPGRTKVNPSPANTVGWKRSVIQVGELQLKNGVVILDRDKNVIIR